MTSERVLIYCAAPLADGGGVQAMVLDLARFLRESGHRVVTAWPDGADSDEQWRLSLCVDKGAGANLRGLKDLVVLVGRLRRLRPDVVNVHFPRGQTLYFVILRKLLGFKLVLSFHNSDIREPTDAVRGALPRFIKAADEVTVVSNDLAPVVRAYHDTEVSIIPNGVDTEWWTPGDGRRDERLVVGAGRLLAMKGFDILLPAFAEGAPHDVRLAIAGEGVDRAALEKQARHLGIEDRVSFSGQLTKVALRDLYRSAGLFVLPSRREGMPLALIEAMACGAPVIATRVNGVPDVVTPDCGTTVPSEDVGAFADALRSWFANSEHDAASRASRGRAISFSDRSTYGTYEQVLIGKPRSGS